MILHPQPTLTARRRAAAALRVTTTVTSQVPQPRHSAAARHSPAWLWQQAPSTNNLSLESPLASQQEQTNPEQAHVLQGGDGQQQQQQQSSAAAESDDISLSQLSTAQVSSVLANIIWLELSQGREMLICRLVSKVIQVSPSRLSLPTLSGKER